MFKLNPDDENFKNLKDFETVKNLLKDEKKFLTKEEYILVFNRELHNHLLNVYGPGCHILMN